MKVNYKGILKRNKSMRYYLYDKLEKLVILWNPYIETFIDNYLNWFIDKYARYKKEKYFTDKW